MSATQPTPTEATPIASPGPTPTTKYPEWAAITADDRTFNVGDIVTPRLNRDRLKLGQHYTVCDITEGGRFIFLEEIGPEPGENDPHWHAWRFELIPPPPPEPPPPPRLLDMTVYPTMHEPGAPISYVLIGAGGIGARFGALLAKLVRAQDAKITVIDPDRVEERNLLRQHFAHDDIGQYKALLVAERIRTALPPNCAHIPVSSITAPFEPIHLDMAKHEGARPTDRVVTICAVDNAKARKAIYAMHEACIIQLDAGNRLRSGQVTLSFCGTRQNWVGLVNGFHRVVNDWDAAITDEAKEAEVASCGLRFDDQTVGSNMLAADVSANLLAALIYGHKVSTAFVEFGTTPPMITPHPLVKDDWPDAQRRRGRRSS